MIVVKLKKFMHKSIYEKKLAIFRNVYYIFHKNKYGNIGKGSYIWKPLFLSGMQYLYMGEKVGIWPGARIEVIDEWEGEKFNPKFIIGDNVNIGQECHITVAECVEIEQNVVCSARVTITDISHITEDKTMPVLKQGIITKPVKICEGAFVGINATILPGVTIGKHSVVGANSVVTKDVPAYETVVGAPARIVSRGE